MSIANVSERPKYFSEWGVVYNGIVIARGFTTFQYALEYAQERRWIQ